MKKILAVVLMMLFTASFAIAANDVFTKLDKNKDGRISEQEYLDQVSGSFDKLDKNHDGALTPDEFQHVDKDKRKQLVKEADANNDGIVIKKEYEQAARKRFSSLDKNKDGDIDK